MVDGGLCRRVFLYHATINHKSKTIQWIQSRRHFFQALRLCVFPNVRHSSNVFAQIYTAQCSTNMAANICIWNSLWLYIIGEWLSKLINQQNIYSSTFSNTLTPKRLKLKSLDKCIFFHNRDRSGMSPSSLKLRCFQFQAPYWAENL